MFYQLLVPQYLLASIMTAETKDYYICDLKISQIKPNYKNPKILFLRKLHGLQ